MKVIDVAILAGSFWAFPGNNWEKGIGGIGEQKNNKDQTTACLRSARIEMSSGILKGFAVIQTSVKQPVTAGMKTS